MGCVAGLQVCLSETPRLSSKASPGLISPIIARWNFSFAGLGTSRIESFGNQLRDLMLIQLFCRVQVFLANLELHAAYTKTVLSKQPSHHQGLQLLGDCFQNLLPLLQFWKSRQYHLSSQEWVDVWNHKRLIHSHHKTQRCVLAELSMKMCLSGQAFEWYTIVELQNQLYFQDELLHQRLWTITGWGLCFLENHLEISIAQASLTFNLLSV